jgi:hypothetical protein
MPKSTGGIGAFRYLKSAADSAMKMKFAARRVFVDF